MSETDALTESELKALVSLLDDRDEGIVQSCLGRLRQEGERAIPYLRDATENGSRQLQREAGMLLTEFEWDLVDQRFLSFAEGSDPIDLEQGALHLSQTYDATVNEAKVRERLDALATTVAARLHSNVDPLEIARTFTVVLGGDYGLRGNESNYYDPENSFLHRVLERRIGIPISLSTVYILVARRLSLPLVGIGMPGHFLVRCGDDAESSVFLDPFRRGKLLDRDGCRELLLRHGLPDSEAHLDPLPDRNILARMIANLLNVYRRGNDTARAARYRKLFERVRGETGGL